MRRVANLAAVTTFLCLQAVGSALTIESTWQYTTVDPGKGWYMPDAKPADCWKTGQAGFGKHGTPGGRVKSIWNTPDIWMRGQYVMPKGQDAAKLSLEVCHDEDFEVYINGVLAARAAGHIKDYALYAISPEARKALKVGPNVIAVHCHQTRGGQYIDVGFTTRTKATVSKTGGKGGRKATPTPPRPAVKTAYVKKATWAETMLALRKATHAAGMTIDMNSGSAVARELWRDFPRQTDWLMQDSAGTMDQWAAGYRDGKGDVTNYLAAARDASLERGLIAKVLPECGSSGEMLSKELAALVSAGAAPEDGRWLDLYARACRVRRQKRLAGLLAKTRQVIFARHHNMGGGFFAYTEYTSWAGNKFGGLFSLDLDNEAAADGTFATTKALIKTDTGGVLRDPELSYDARRLLFAWRKDKSDRWYKIYEMDLATGATRLITGGGRTYGASYDPVYLPDGNILFNSSRVIQCVDCAGPDVSNLYICDKDGKFARRVGFSFPKRVQPILDKHCVSCHTPGGKTKASTYVLTGEQVLDAGAKRKWLRSYLTLTNTPRRGPDQFDKGRTDAIVDWISNSSEPTMIPPQYGGSTRSKLVTMLETGRMPPTSGPEKPKLKLSRREMDTLCAWIDLVIPFGGDYVEANAWTEGELKTARERLRLRQEADQRDLDNIAAMLRAVR